MARRAKGRLGDSVKEQKEQTQGLCEGAESDTFRVLLIVFL